MNWAKCYMTRSRCGLLRGLLLLLGLLMTTHSIPHRLLPPRSHLILAAIALLGVLVGVLGVVIFLAVIHLLVIPLVVLVVLAGQSASVSTGLPDLMLSAPGAAAFRCRTPPG